MDTKLILREAAKHELSEVAEITRISYSEYAKESDANAWQEYEASSRKTILSSEDAQCLVVVLENNLIASILFCPPYELKLGDTLVKNPYPEMRLLAVLPQYRNLGAGKLLIDECEKRARSAGLPAITLHTTRLMKIAKDMYERRGYSRYPQIDFNPSPNITVLGYKKELH